MYQVLTWHFPENECTPKLWLCCLRKTKNRELENVSAEHLSLLLSPHQNSKSNNNFMYLTWATRTTTTTTKAKAKQQRRPKEQHQVESSSGFYDRKLCHDRKRDKSVIFFQRARAQKLFLAAFFWYVFSRVRIFRPGLLVRMWAIVVTVSHFQWLFNVGRFNVVVVVGWLLMIVTLPLSN